MLPNASVRIDPNQRPILNLFLQVCRHRPQDLPFVEGVMQALLDGAKVTASVEQLEPSVIEHGE